MQPVHVVWDSGRALLHLLLQLGPRPGQVHWDKPGEITPAFTGIGFGIVAYGGADIVVGVDATRGIYFLWLSNSQDPAGSAEACPVTASRPALAPWIDRLAVFPNPFNPRTTIAFELAQAAELSVQLLDARGGLVRDFGTQRRAAGPQRIVWAGDDRHGVRVASGLHFVRLSTPTQSAQIRLLLLR